MARLFKDRTIKDALERFEISELEAKIRIIKSWREAQENGMLHQKTETQCEQAFNHDFFIKVLGHISFPNDFYTIDPKARTETSAQKPDAVLGYFASDEKHVHAVCEIKDANTALDRPQQREGNLTPVQQAFKYKPQYSRCDFVIVTNFVELRIYRDNQLDYEKFTLESLTDPIDNYYQFRKFYYLLAKENLVAKTGQTTTEKILSAIRIEEEEISKKFYGEYRKLRHELIDNIRKNNRAVPIATVVEKAQKIIDRIVFVSFCEDIGLLQDNKLMEVIQYAEKNSPFDTGIWKVMIQFFDAVDRGSEKLEIPNGYNGELFKEDAVLNELEIDDVITKKFVGLGRYSFSEDLTVNILGHIFEQSISDIESLKAEFIEGSEPKQDAKRKKDGIYYTPEYIVDHIVQNSLGKYLEEKESSLKQKHRLKSDILDENYEKRARKVYEEYQQFLQGIKIIDPACGSGAFLVKVFDYLLTENQRVAYILQDLRGGQQSSLDQEDFIKNVLHNNIYGVDINPESVEITKLSLWLKTAQKGKKLTVLKDNIKCGNSIIDDADVVGDRAFNWQREFGEILQFGGFDVVVGNPPYGAKLTAEEQSFLREKFNVGSTDTAIIFMKLSMTLLKEGGINSFIVPKPFIYASNWHKIRHFIFDNLWLLVDCKQVWKEVKLEQVIYSATKDRKYTEYQAGKRTGESFTNRSSIAKSLVEEFGFFLNDVSEQDINIARKVKAKHKTLKDFGENQRGGMFQRDITKESSGRKVLGGDSIHRYLTVGIKGFLPHGIDIDERAELRDNAVLVQNIIAHIQNPVEHIKITATVEGGDYLILDTINQIALNDEISNKYILLILNSKLINWYVYRFIFAKAIRTMHFDNKVTDRIPIPVLSIDEQQPFIEVADSLLSLNKQFQNKLHKTLQLISSELSIEKTISKLQRFYEIDFDEFIKAAGKKRISVNEKDQLFDYFNDRKKELVELRNEIQKTERQGNYLVNNLYGLIDQETRLFEVSSTNAI